MKDNNYNIIATIKPWNISFFKKKIKLLKGDWKIVTNPSQLKIKKSKIKKVKNIFFIHWSYLVSKDILKKYNCICFHMTNLPYGRGGTPLQNLIIRKKKYTNISAFIMNDQIDSGDLIKIKREKLVLNGSAQQIYERSSKIIFNMIKKIIKMKKIITHKQKGQIINFKRLKNNSEIDVNSNNLNNIYDHIRMLDAKTYKNAYIKIGKLKIDFFNVKKLKNRLKSDIIINFC